MITQATGYQRLNQQRLTGNKLTTPEGVVEWLGAVQSQEYAPAKWSLALRMQNLDDALIEQAFNEGRILRTHVMRPTWHFVLPADIRWMLELTAPRLKMQMMPMFRQNGLDEALLARANAVIARALEGGKQMTRAELGEALTAAGITIHNSLQLGFITGRAEIDLVICSGGRRGKQMTYALLDERAPNARRLSREEGLAEMTRRYFRGHGPATVYDFSWWSGLTVGDSKTGIAMIGDELASEVVEGQTYWYSAALTPSAEPSAEAILMPTYDEYLVGYDQFAKSSRGGQAIENNMFYSTIVVGGRVLGSWRRTFKKNAVRIELAPFAPLNAAEEAAVIAASERYGAFLNMPVVLEFTHLNAPTR